MSNPAEKLHSFGQSVWYDNISREILRNGELKRLIAEWGVRGLTSNPTIFDNAISKGSFYDEQIAELKAKNLSTDQVFEELAIADIAEAADLLLPIYQESSGTDGFVSIEVSPLLARDTQATIEEGKRLFDKLARPNIMIKVPGTEEGIPAVYALLEQGVSVNITLLFSVENYIQVAQTYIDALNTRLDRGDSVDKIRSVASFFVSRVDSSVDKKLEELVAAGNEQAKSLLGQFGVANSKLAYQEYEKLFLGSDFEKLRKAGAAVQRPLWASTSTKNPEYRDVLYIEELIGEDTVNTIPHATLEAFVDHGNVAKTLTEDVANAQQVLAGLLELGVDVDSILKDLQVEGVKKFSDSFTALNETIEKK